MKDFNTDNQIIEAVFFELEESKASLVYLKLLERRLKEEAGILGKIVSLTEGIEIHISTAFDNLLLLHS